MSAAPRSRRREAGAILAVLGAGALVAFVALGATVPDLPALESELFVGLEAIDEATLAKLRELDPAIFPPDVKRTDVRVMNLPRARALLDQLVDGSWGSLHYFANPLFERDRRLIYYPPEVLTVLTKEYRTGSLFPSHGRMRRSFRVREGVVQEGTYFELQALVVGRSTVTAVYPTPISIDRTDPPFDLYDGHYDFFRVNQGTIATRAGTAWVLEGLRGRDHPREPFRTLRGPLRMPIERLDMAWEGDAVTVRTLFFMRLMFAHPMFQRWSPPLYDRPSLSVGIPESSLERARELARSG
jgi:hypothetical protein